MLLRGKNREEFTPFLNFGDHVIVVNAARVRMTGAAGTAATTGTTHRATVRRRR
jgi:ribosomal protein L13